MMECRIDFLERPGPALLNETRHPRNFDSFDHLSWVDWTGNKRGGQAGYLYTSLAVLRLPVGCCSATSRGFFSQKREPSWPILVVQNHKIENDPPDLTHPHPHPHPTTPTARRGYQAGRGVCAAKPSNRPAAADNQREDHRQFKSHPITRPNDRPSERMGARKRLQSNNRKTQKQHQQRFSSSSSSGIQAAAVLLGWESSSKRDSRLSYALAVVALALVVLLCAVSSSKAIRMGAASSGNKIARVDRLVTQSWVPSAIRTGWLGVQVSVCVCGGGVVDRSTEPSWRVRAGWSSLTHMF